MKCKNCQLENTLDEDGCEIVCSDDMWDNGDGNFGCDLKQSEIDKAIKHHNEVIEPDIIRQMGDMANFIAEESKDDSSN